MSEKYSTDELIGYLENVGFTPPYLIWIDFYWPFIHVRKGVRIK